MMSTDLQKAMNDQINSEFFAAYTYLSMAAWFEEKDLGGFAHWMRVQYSEELSHALKFFDFITDRNGRVLLQPISQPPVEFNAVQDVMEQALAHEKEVTAQINRLYETAQRSKDYATHGFLEWFLEEQVEEEKTATELVEHTKMIGSDGAGLLMLDARLGTRGQSGSGAQTT